MERKTPKLYSAKLASRREVAKDTPELTFRVDDPDFFFSPGQYVWVIVPNLISPDERGERRAFSIVSAPARLPEISIVYRTGSSGYKSTLAAMQAGTEVKIWGPFGSLSINEDKPAVFLAGGVALAPLMSILEDAASRKSNFVLTLFTSNPGVEEVPYRGRLNELKSQLSGLKIYEAIGKLDWQMIGGVVTEPAKSDWYVIGLQDMVDASTKLLIEHGVKPESLHFEQFYGFRDGPDASELENEIAKANPRDMFRLAVEQASDHILVTDQNGTIVYANEAAQKITGYSIAEMTGQTPRLWGGMMDKAFYSTLWQTIKIDRKPFIATVTNRRKNDEIYTARLRISPIVTQNKLVGFVATEVDITRETEIDREKTEFLSIAAHQLRTPLGIIRWNLEMVKEGDMGAVPKEISESLDEVYESDLRLISLVNDLLDVSRIDERRKLGKAVPTDAAEVIAKVIEAEKSSADKKKLKLSFTPPATKLNPVMVDPAHFFQVIDNLISNSIKYTYEGKGIIEVSVAEKDGRLIISVTDNGIGILPEDKRMIFNKFYRGKNAGKIEANGSGLGLFVVKSFVEGWGGRVSFVSENEKGSTFTVEIPVEVKK